jgi:DNA-binding response OmpR family regulator
VLLVEDDEAVRGLVGLALREAGLAVTLAGDGQEAVEFYRLHHAEVVAVLRGLKPLAGLDGPWTLVALKGIDPGVRRCFLSGDTGDYDTAMLLALGACCVLHKPLRLADLREALQRLVG